MGLQFSTRSTTGRPYQEAYAKLAFIKVDRTNQILDVWFNNYPTKAIRDADLTAFFSQNNYTLTKEVQPASLSHDNPDAFNEEQKNYLETMGVTIEKGKFIHDGEGKLNYEWLEQAGIKVESYPKPTYAKFVEENAETMGQVTTLIEEFLTAQESPVDDIETGEVCENGVQDWSVLYIDPVAKTVKLVTRNFIDTDILAESKEDPRIAPCSQNEYRISAKPQPAGKDAKGRETKPLPGYDEFIGGTAAAASDAIDALAFTFAKSQPPYRNAEDVIDAAIPEPTPD